MTRSDSYEKGLNSIWDNVLSYVEKNLEPVSFKNWFEHSKIKEFNNEKLKIEVKDDFNKYWIENNYVDLIKEAVKETTGADVSIEVNAISEQKDTTLYDSNKTRNDEAQKDELPTPNKLLDGILNENNTFETFVTGSGNQFAHAASLAVAESPAKAYNPFFIYGGVGLGKTHLMQAIGHYVKKTKPDANIVYLSSEKFTNDFINSIRDNKTEQFRNKYRNVDLLLIDDIQFLAGKEQTQEEFFHTFNALHEAKKQIVMTSDRTPKDIPTLEDRLVNRFEWGLITDITPPDLETRIAILKKKCAEDGLNIPSDLLSYIANHISTNVRELEGALNRVIAYSNIVNEELTLDIVSEALKDIVRQPAMKRLSIQDIQTAVGEHFNIDIEMFTSKSRKAAIALPRQIAMYLSREMTEYSLPNIGEKFGGRDHTTVIHAYDKIKKLAKDDPTMKRDLDAIKQKLIDN